MVDDLLLIPMKTMTTSLIRSNNIKSVKSYQRFILKKSTMRYYFTPICKNCKVDYHAVTLATWRNGSLWAAGGRAGQ